MATKIRRHHRVAKKQVEISGKRGVFIPKDHKTALGIVLIGMSFIAFALGTFIGFIAGRD